MAEGGHTQKGKPGFVAHEAGAFVEIALPGGSAEEGRTGVSLLAAGSSARVRLHYLRSYEHMGAVGPDR